MRTLVSLGEAIARPCSMPYARIRALRVLLRRVIHTYASWSHRESLYLGFWKRESASSLTCIVSKSTCTSIWWYDTIRGKCNSIADATYDDYGPELPRDDYSARSRATRIIYYNYPHVGMSSLLANSSSNNGAFNSRRSFGTWIICYTRRGRNYVAFINHGVQSRATRLRRIFYNLFSYVQRAVIYSIGRPS